MQTFILADRNQNSLGPLNSKYCPALLPIAGRPLIIHTIEDLVDAGIKKVHVVISAQAYEIETLLGDGSSWGIEIEYILSQGEELPSEIIKRQGKNVSDQLLIVRGDILRTPVIRDFMDRLKNIDADAIHACSNHEHTGVSYFNIHSITQETDILKWPIEKIQNTTDKLINIESASISYLDSIDNIYDTCMNISRKHFKGITHAGLKTETGYIHGKNHKVSKSCELSAGTSLGDNTFIGDDVTTVGHVIIGNDVLIDSGARLKNCIIYENTYVGCNTNIENSIVYGNNIYKIDSCNSININDNFLLSPLSIESASITDRFLGLALFIISIPLWPLAALLAFIISPGNPLQARNICSNRKIYTGNHSFVNLKVKAYEWNVPIRTLRYLPWIYNVLSGDIRLIGASPCFESKDPILEIINDSKDTPQLGLISTATLELPSGTPAFERRIHEIVYDKRRSFISDIRYILSSVRHVFTLST